MSPLLSLLPGFSQAAVVMNALGLTKPERQALDSLYQRIRSAPGFRSMPAEVIPASFDSLIQFAIGTAKLSGATFSLPTWLIPVLSNPVVRKGLATELARLVDSDPGREKLLSAIGKTIRVAAPDTDPSMFPGLPELIDGLVFEKLLTKQADPEIHGHMITCTLCHFSQYVANMPPNGTVECRQCGCETKVQKHD